MPSTSSIVRMRPISSSGNARASWPLTCRKRGEPLSDRAGRSGRPMFAAGALAVRDRLQHQARKPDEAPRASPICSSRNGRQDRQGASRLQRHHHDGDLPDVP
jgi:hypothetical protein